MKYALWIVQVLLAAVYLFAGGSKLAMSAAEIQQNMPFPLPAWFVPFIGTCEILGAFGLILPSLLRIKPGLTPLAAAGLVIIMTGATVLTAMYMAIGLAIGPLVLGILAAFVAYGRTKLVPIAAR